MAPIGDFNVIAIGAGATGLVTTAATAGLDRVRAFKVNHRVLPWCTYTAPEIARVGWNEREARAAGRDVELAHVDRFVLEREKASSR